MPCSEERNQHDDFSRHGFLFWQNGNMRSGLGITMFSLVALTATPLQAQFHKKTESGATAVVLGPKIGSDLSDLPENVSFEKGGISVFVDFENTLRRRSRSFAQAIDRAGADDGFRVTSAYLINDTDEAIILPTQDSNLYLKQEVREDGKWVRSHSHRYSGCGNSYLSLELPARSYVTFRVLLDSSDEEPARLVRYRFYNGHPELESVVSNLGDAQVSVELMEMARFDEMAIRHAELPLLLDLVSGEIRGFANDFLHPRASALMQLERFEPAPEIADAVEVFLDDLDDELVYRRHLFVALRVFGKSASPDRVLEKVDRFLRSSEEQESRQTAISFLGSHPSEAKAGRRERFEQILSQSDHPDFIYALNAWAISDLATEEEKRVRLRQWREDRSIPRVVRRAAEETYRYVFPNLYYRSSWSKDRETGLLSVTIRNISHDEISFSYDHPFEIVKFDFRDAHDFTFPGAWPVSRYSGEETGGQKSNYPAAEGNPSNHRS